MARDYGSEGFAQPWLLAWSCSPSPASLLITVLAPIRGNRAIYQVRTFKYRCAAAARCRRRTIIRRPVLT